MAYSNYTIPTYRQPPMVTAPGYSDAAQAPAPVNVYGTDTGTSSDDYLAKKRIAEVLRKQAEGYGSASPQANSYTTAASGAYPGQTDVNWGGIISNGLNNFMAGKTSQKAAAAEGEAAATRRAALEQLMGKENLTARDAIMAKETYDADLSSLVVDSRAEKQKALAMIAQNPAMAALYISQGTVTPDEIAAYDARDKSLSEQETQAELDDYLRRKEIDQRFTPKPNETDAQFFQRDPEGYLRYKQAGFKPTGGGVTQIGTDADGNPVYGQEKSGLPAGSITSWGTAAREYQDLADRAGVQGAGIQRLMGDLAASNPNLKDTIGQLASNNGFNSVAELLRSPEARNMSSETIRLAVENARLLAPVSNTDFDKLLAVYPTVLTDKDAAARFFTELNRQSTGAQERNQNLAAHATAIYSGVVDPGMLPSTFKRKVEGAKAKADPDEQQYWDDLEYDEKYEIARRTGAFR